MKTDIKKLVDTTKKIIKKKDDEIRLLKQTVIEANGERIVSFKMPADMTVGNFPKLQKVEIINHPTIQKVSVDNFKDVQKVEVTNTPEIKVNIESEKASKWVPNIILLTADKIMIGITKIIGRGVPVTLDASERLKPMTVVLVDTTGKPVDMSFPVRTAPAYPIVLPGSTSMIASSCISGRIVVGTTFTAGTPYQLPAQGCKRIVFTSLATNGGLICIGGSKVSAQGGSEKGAPLYPLGSVQIDVNNAQALYVDGATNGDVLVYNIFS